MGGVAYNILMAQFLFIASLPTRTLISYYLPIFAIFIHIKLTFGLPGPSGKETVGIEEKLYFQKCSSQQRTEIYLVFDAVKKILQGVRTPDWTTSAAIDYMGTNYIDTWGPYKNKVERMLEVANSWIERSYWFSGPVVTCETPGYELCEVNFETDDVLILYDKGEEGPRAQLYITICPSWWQKSFLRLLIEQGKHCLDKVLEEDGLYKEGRPFDLRWYESRELWLLHAIFHIREVYWELPTEEPPENRPPDFNHLIVGQPFHDSVRFDASYRADQAVLDPWSAKKLATNGVGRDWFHSGPLGSPTNYALYALAEYVTKQIGEYPHLPDAMKRAGSPWIGDGDILHMCPGFNGASIPLGNTSYIPSQTEWAISPWVFTPETPPI